MNLNLLNYTSIILTNYNISSKRLKKLLEHFNKNNLKLNLKEFKIKFNLDDIEIFRDNYKFDPLDIFHIVEHQLLFSRIHYEEFNKYINLKSLIIYNDRYIQDNDIKNLYNLEKLILPKNKLLTDRGLENLNKLKVLELDFNKNITNKSIINKKDLEILKLIHNKNIHDEGFINIHKLKYLNLGYNNCRKLNLTFLEHNDVKTLILYKKKNISENMLDLIKKIEIKYTYNLNI